MSIDQGKDLLFGVIALQMNFITQERFVEVMTLLPGAPGKSAEELFLEKGYVREEELAALRGLIQVQLARNGGDVEKSIAAFEGNAAIEQSMVLVGAKERRGAVSEATTQTIVLERKPEQRYLLGRELGRGGLGKVMLAMDRDLVGREVAMKLMLEPGQAREAKPPAAAAGREKERLDIREGTPGSTPPARERFLEEAQITGQMWHPNVIPVLELGTRPSGELYYTMPVVMGRTLKRAIEEAHDSLTSGETLLGDWGLKRMALLQSYQGLCYGIAYAHSRGVIHRDIKPANVMVGEYGETIVVDWGLAKVIRQGPAGSAGSSALGSREAVGEGEEVGCEATVDFAAPAVSSSMALRADGLRPSTSMALRADGLWPSRKDEQVQADRQLRKMIRSIREQTGYKTMEGAVTGTPAYMAPEQARGEVASIDERSDIYSLGAVLFELLTGRPPFAGETGYAVLFQVMRLAEAPDPRRYRELAPIPDDLAEVCVKAMAPAQRDRYGTVKELLGDVVAAIEGGKERERNHRKCLARLGEGRELVAEYRELSGKIGELVAAVKEAEARVKPYEEVNSEGKRKVEGLRAELREARWLAGAAFNRVLVTLTDALAFEPENQEARRELGEFHYEHMVKAERQQDRKTFEFHKAQVESLNDGALDGRLRGDGSLSIETNPPGAEVQLYRYEEEGRRLVARPYREGEPACPPAGAADQGAALPGTVASAGTGGPTIPPGHALGRAPVGPIRLPMGSYLLILKREGYRDTRVPFLVGRLEEVRLSVKLYREEEIGEGMVYVPGGKFLMGEGESMREEEVCDFFIGKFPVTFGAYCRYLDWLEEHDPEQVKKRAPQDRVNGLLVRKDEQGRYYPFDPSPAPGASERLADLLPVFSVSWHDAVAYCAWLSEQEGREYGLPKEVEWEKAARGTDGRIYPWGNGFDATLCKMAESTKEAPQPEPVGSYEQDQSPYGVRDMAGGIMDWCEDWYDERKVWKVARGGYWAGASGLCRSVYRIWDGPGVRDSFDGFRLLLRPGVLGRSDS